MLDHHALQTARRAWLRQAVAMGVGCACPAWVLANSPAFDGKTWAQVARALGAKSLTASAEVRLSTLDYAENGAAVPIEMGTTLPGVDRLVLFVEKNPTPLAAVFQLSESVEPSLTVHTKLAQSGGVFVLAITADGRGFFAQKMVKVVLGSCGSAPDTPDAADTKRPTEPTRIRAQIQGESAMVRMRMAHEMESGQRKTPAGKVLPAWHIEQVSVNQNGKPVLTAEWGPAVAKNPYLQFTLKKAKAGDRLSAFWRDNLAMTRSDDMLLV